MNLAPWRSPLSHAIYRNRSLPHSRYIQLATVGLDGYPRNRTVVFRGFRPETNQLQIVTDTRSEKYQQIEKLSFAEVCWYFPKTREQFRFLGKLILISSETDDLILLKARSLVWQELSDSARSQFAWATPKLPLNQNQPTSSSFPVTRDIPTSNFSLILLEPLEVDYLELRGDPQNRYLYTFDTSQTWICQQVNP